MMDNNKLVKVLQIKTIRFNNQDIYLCVLLALRKIKKLKIIKRKV